MANNTDYQKVLVGMFLVLMVAWIPACNKEEETSKPKQVVSRKIVPPKPDASKKDAGKRVEKPKKAATTEKVKAGPKVASSSKEVKKIASKTPTVQVPAKEAAGPGVKGSEKIAIADDRLVDDNPIALASLYNPVGRVDPFESPLRKKAPTRKKKKRAPQTPLERIDLGQLKLTAVLEQGKDRTALVEESTGRGYIVEVGTYIGIHGGQISEITRTSIIVSEEVETVRGEIELKKSELKLLKPLGD